VSVVAFDFAKWTARYPEFAAVNPTLAAMFFGEAGMYCDNTDVSPVPSGAPTYRRDTFLYMLTSHIAWLAGQGTGNTPGAGGLVGRIASAAEGSVNVATELEGQLQGRAWFAQTRYGLDFWQASALYRTSLYIAPCGPLQSGYDRSWPLGFPL
jgi:hypothetical protein